MKLTAKLKSFKKYFGMTAELRNSNGEVIDTITIGENGQGKKLKFQFDKSDLNGDNNVEIVFEDNNGDDKNFEKGKKTYDMSPDDQDFDITLPSKKKSKTVIKLKGDKLSGEIPQADTTGPIFTSGTSATASETITAGSIVYTATATDDSPPVTYSLSGNDAGSFSINAQGQVSINTSPDFASQSSYSFNVIGTDAVGNSTTHGVALAITEAPVDPPVDSTGPIFTSGTSATASETITAGSIVYTASAIDDSPPVTYSLSGTDAGSFSVNTQGQVSINTSPDFASQSSYSFNVVGTDAVGNSTTHGVALTITEAPVIIGDTINLTTFQDVYDEATGTTLNGAGVQIPRAERLSSLDNSIIGTAGELGQLDSLSDPSTSDNDTLILATSAAASSLQVSLATIQNLTNLENLVVNASNDDSTLPDFARVIETDTLDVNGFFTTSVTLDNFFDSAQISSFDFSGSTNPNIGFTIDPVNNNDVQTFSNESLSFIGSPGDDIFIASIAAATMIGGNGNDVMTGSISSSTYMEGGNGTDSLILEAANAAQDTINYQGITTANNANNVFNFVGFLDTANNPTQTDHDILEFDDDTVTNFTADATIQQKNAAQLAQLLGTAAADNHILFQTNPEAENLSAHGKSWIALDDTNGALWFSQDGNFAANAEQIGTITFTGTAAEFLSNQQVTVV